MPFGKLYTSKEDRAAIPCKMVLDTEGLETRKSELQKEARNLCMRLQGSSVETLVLVVDLDEQTQQCFGSIRGMMYLLHSKYKFTMLTEFGSFCKDQNAKIQNPSRKRKSPSPSEHGITVISDSDEDDLEVVGFTVSSNNPSSGSSPAAKDKFKDVTNICDRLRAQNIESLFLVVDLSSCENHCFGSEIGLKFMVNMKDSGSFWTDFIMYCKEKSSIKQQSGDSQQNRSSQGITVLIDEDMEKDDTKSSHGSSRCSLPSRRSSVSSVGVHSNIDEGEMDWDSSRMSDESTKIDGRDEGSDVNEDSENEKEDDVESVEEYTDSEEEMGGNNRKKSLDSSDNDRERIREGTVSENEDARFDTNVTADTVRKEHSWKENFGREDGMCNRGDKSHLKHVEYITIDAMDSFEESNKSKSYENEQDNLHTRAPDVDGTEKNNQQREELDELEGTERNWERNQEIDNDSSPLKCQVLNVCTLRGTENNDWDQVDLTESRETSALLPSTCDVSNKGMDQEKSRGQEQGQSSDNTTIANEQCSKDKNGFVIHVNDRESDNWEIHVSASEGVSQSNVTTNVSHSCQSTSESQELQIVNTWSEREQNNAPVNVSSELINQNTRSADHDKVIRDRRNVRLRSLLNDRYYTVSKNTNSRLRKIINDQYHTYQSQQQNFANNITQSTTPSTVSFANSASHSATTSYVNNVTQSAMAATVSYPSNDATERLSESTMPNTVGYPSNDATERLSASTTPHTVSCPSNNVTERLSTITTPHTVNCPSKDATERLSTITTPHTVNYLSNDATERLSANSTSHTVSYPSNNMTERLSANSMSHSVSCPSNKVTERLSSITRPHTVSYPSNNVTERLSSNTTPHTVNYPSNDVTEILAANTLPHTVSYPSNDVTERLSASGKCSHRVLKCESEEIYDSVAGDIEELAITNNNLSENVARNIRKRDRVPQSIDLTEEDPRSPSDTLQDSGYNSSMLGDDSHNQVTAPQFQVSEKELEMDIMQDLLGRMGHDETEEMWNPYGIHVHVPYRDIGQYSYVETSSMPIPSGNIYVTEFTNLQSLSSHKSRQRSIDKTQNNLINYLNEKIVSHISQEEILKGQTGVGKNDNRNENNVLGHVNILKKQKKKRSRKSDPAAGRKNEEVRNEAFPEIVAMEEVVETSGALDPSAQSLLLLSNEIVPNRGLSIKAKTNKSSKKKLEINKKLQQISKGNTQMEGTSSTSSAKSNNKPNNQKKKKARSTISRKPRKQAAKKDVPVWCVCRSPDISRFMIGCDNCDEWYHGTCIGITRKEAETIDKFFCDACLVKNPRMRIIYKSGVKAKFCQSKEFLSNEEMRRLIQKDKDSSSNINKEDQKAVVKGDTEEKFVVDIENVEDDSNDATSSWNSVSDSTVGKDHTVSIKPQQSNSVMQQQGNLENKEVINLDSDDDSNSKANAIVLPHLEKLYTNVKEKKSLPKQKGTKVTFEKLEPKNGVSSSNIHLSLLKENTKSEKKIRAKKQASSSKEIHPFLLFHTYCRLQDDYTVVCKNSRGEYMISSKKIGSLSSPNMVTLLKFYEQRKKRLALKKAEKAAAEGNTVLAESPKQDLVTDEQNQNVTNLTLSNSERNNSVPHGSPCVNEGTVHEISQCNVPCSASDTQSDLPCLYPYWQEAPSEGMSNVTSAANSEFLASSLSHCEELVYEEAVITSSYGELQIQEECPLIYLTSPDKITEVEMEGFHTESFNTSDTDIRWEVQEHDTNINSPSPHLVRTSHDTGRPSSDVNSPSPSKSKRKKPIMTHSPKKRLSADDSDTDPVCRANHNLIEMKRRLELKDLFNCLKQELPRIARTENASRALILKEANSAIESLKLMSVNLQEEVSQQVCQYERLRRRLGEITGGENSAFMENTSNFFIDVEKIQKDIDIDIPENSDLEDNDINVEVNNDDVLELRNISGKIAGTTHDPGIVKRKKKRKIKNQAVEMSLEILKECLPNQADKDSLSMRKILKEAKLVIKDLEQQSVRLQREMFKVTCHNAVLKNEAKSKRSAVREKMCEGNLSPTKGVHPTCVFVNAFSEEDHSEQPDFIVEKTYSDNDDDDDNDDDELDQQTGDADSHDILCSTEDRNDQLTEDHVLDLSSTTSTKMSRSSIAIHDFAYEVENNSDKDCDHDSDIEAAGLSMTDCAMETEFTEVKVTQEEVKSSDLEDHVSNKDSRDNVQNEAMESNHFSDSDDTSSEIEENDVIMEPSKSVKEKISSGTNKKDEPLNVNQDLSDCLLVLDCENEDSDRGPTECLLMLDCENANDDDTNLLSKSAPKSECESKVKIKDNQSSNRLNDTNDEKTETECGIGTAEKTGEEKILKKRDMSILQEKKTNEDSEVDRVFPDGRDILENLKLEDRLSEFGGDSAQTKVSLKNKKDLIHVGHVKRGTLELLDKEERSSSEDSALGSDSECLDENEASLECTITLLSPEGKNPNARSDTEDSRAKESDDTRTKDKPGDVIVSSSLSSSEDRKIKAADHVTTASDSKVDDVQNMQMTRPKISSLGIKGIKIKKCFVDLSKCIVKEDSLEKYVINSTSEKKMTLCDNAFESNKEQKIEHEEVKDIQSTCASEVLDEHVPEVLDEHVPEVLDEHVPEVSGEHVPEVSNEHVSEVSDEHVPEVLDEHMSEVLDKHEDSRDRHSDCVSEVSDKHDKKTEEVEDAVLTDSKDDKDTSVSVSPLVSDGEDKCLLTFGDDTEMELDSDEVSNVEENHESNSSLSTNNVQEKISDTTNVEKDLEVISAQEMAKDNHSVTSPDRREDRHSITSKSNLDAKTDNSSSKRDFEAAKVSETDSATAVSPSCSCPSEDVKPLNKMQLGLQRLRNLFKNTNISVKKRPAEESDSNTTVKRKKSR